MIYRRGEGELVRNGINLYPRHDPASVGGILKLGPFRIRIRYAKRTGILYRSVEWRDRQWRPF